MSVRLFVLRMSSRLIEVSYERWTLTEKTKPNNLWNRILLILILILLSASYRRYNSQFHIHTKSTWYLFTFTHSHQTGIYFSRWRLQVTHVFFDCYQCANTHHTMWMADTNILSADTCLTNRPWPSQFLARNTKKKKQFKSHCNGNRTAQMFKSFLVDSPLLCVFTDFRR